MFEDIFHLNGECQYKLTALHRAAASKDTKMIEFLLQNGADVNATDKKGLTPLHFMALNGNNGDLKINI